MRGCVARQGKHDEKRSSDLSSYPPLFISSTSQDLLAHREAVHDIVVRMGPFAVDMAQFGSQGSGDAVEVSTDKVAGADIYEVMRLSPVYTSLPRASRQWGIQESSARRFPDTCSPTS